MAIYQSEPVAKLLSRLNNVKEVNGQWMASCPCRTDDETPSLAVKVGDQDEALVYCHRGLCDATKIFQSCGLDLIKDGFAQKPTNIFSNTWKGSKSSSAASVSSVSAKKPKKKLTKTYVYHDEDGNVLYEKLRFEHDDGKKSFIHRRPDPNKQGDYLYNLTDTRKVLYRLPEILKAIAANETVWLVEGEKDADTMLQSFGIPATTMTNGANNWQADYTVTLAAATAVCIIADNDDPGKRHAISVRDEIIAAGGRATVYVSKHAKDISDHVAMGYVIDTETMFELTSYESTAEKSEVAENETELSDDEKAEIGNKPEDKLLTQIQDIMSMERLSLQQKLSRISFAANSFTTASFEDYGRTVNWQEFLLEAESDAYEWVIPGLLEKQERVIVVAAEGVGKTMLARQVAIGCAAGLHPFTFQPMPPIRTLTIDLENPARIIRRTSRTIMENAIRLSHATTVDAHLHIHPAGLDLASSKDRGFVEQLVDRIRPELICLGPLYKAYVDNGSLTSEALAVEVAKFLDHIRDVYGCALWLEHHAPLGSSNSTRELRPFGSSVWSRWPEFGISITPDPLNPDGYVYDVKHFRGARDKRAWPTKMKRSLRLPFEVLEFMKEL